MTKSADAMRESDAQGRRTKGRKKKRRTRNDVAFPRPFTVRDSKVQGRGGFALRWIRKGERIVEYVGERITPDEADERYDDEKGKRHHTFLFSVNEKTVIDAAVDGNEARFINHSCDPNCEAVDRRGRIYIEAIRDIAPGEELFYDYNFELDEPLTKELIRRYPCHCGSDDCRGTILVEKKKKKKKKKKKGKKKKQGSKKDRKKPGKDARTGKRKSGGNKGAGKVKGKKKGVGKGRRRKSARDGGR